MAWLHRMEVDFFHPHFPDTKTLTNIKKIKQFHMKIYILSIILILPLITFSQEENHYETINGKWSTNTNYPDTKIIIGDLDKTYLFNINRISINNPDTEVSIYRKDRDNVKFNEGSHTIISSDKSTIVSNFEAGQLSQGFWRIIDFDKEIKGASIKWNMSSIGNIKSTTLLDSDSEFFFFVNIQNTDCNDVLFKVIVDGNIVLKDDGTNLPFPFRPGNGFIGFGKKVEISMIGGFCTNLEVVNVDFAIYE
jgi:hypothetical protein